MRLLTIIEAQVWREFREHLWEVDVPRTLLWVELMEQLLMMIGSQIWREFREHLRDNDNGIIIMIKGIMIMIMGLQVWREFREHLREVQLYWSWSAWRRWRVWCPGEQTINNNSLMIFGREIPFLLLIAGRVWVDKWGGSQSSCKVSCSQHPGLDVFLFEKHLNVNNHIWALRI